MNEKEFLERLGLPPHESAIYLALLGSKALTVSAVAKKTGLHRPTIYHALPGLLNRGLISLVPKGKQKHYLAESPNRLQKTIEGLTVDLQTMLPTLLQTHEATAKRPVVKFLEGRAGIRQVFDDLVRTLNRGDVYFRYSSRSERLKAKEYLPSDYRTIRDQKKLERFVITNERNAKTKKPRLERAIKTVPANFDLFEYDIAQIIYAGKVAFIDYNSETALVIENPIIAEFQTKIFKLLYSKL